MPDTAALTRIDETIQALPLSFETNQGQAEKHVRFVARGRGNTLLLSSAEMVLVLPEKSPQARLQNQRTIDAGEGFCAPFGRFRGRTARTRGPSPRAGKMSMVRVRLEGANPNPEAAGMGGLPGKVNYFIGNDPRKWHSNISTYRGVKYSNVYPGIDLVYYGNQRQLEHDFIVAPGADPTKILYAFQGTDELKVDGNGDLVIDDFDRGVRFRKPLIYQEDDGKRHDISGGYELAGRHQVRFRIGMYDKTTALIIDPVFVYSSCLGGSGDEDRASSSEIKRADIAVDAEGNAYVTGNTDSIDFPMVSPLQGAPAGTACPPPGDYSRPRCIDAFVLKLSPSGSLIYSTYLGGSSLERGFGIAVDGSGSAYVAGRTQSTNFPTVNPLQKMLRGTEDAFVSKLAPDGSALVYSTYLGGSSSDDAVSIAVDSSGSAFIVGETQSTDFPTVNPFQRVFGGMLDVYVAKLSPDGSALVFSTYLGGSGPDDTEDVAVDSAGNAYVTGTTASTDFPTLNALQPTLKNFDAFVSKFNATGSMVYSTYLGGSGNEAGTSLAVDDTGSVYVAGITLSADFPVANALKASAGDTFFKSANGGDSWVANSAAPNAIKSLAMDPAVPSTIYAGTSQGVFKSTNGGQTWSSVNIGLSASTVYGLAVGPKNPSTLYAGVFGAGVFKSNNSGETWNSVNSGLENKDILALAVSPSDPSTIYVGCNYSSRTNSAGVYRSANGGETWAYVGTGLEDAYGIYALAIDPDQPETVYAGGNGTYKTTNGGQTWIRSSLDSSPLVLVIDPSNTNNVFAGTYEGFSKSTDAGTTWAASNAGLRKQYVQCLALSSTIPSTIYAGTSEGVYKSEDVGVTWRSVGAIMAKRDIKALVVDPANPSTLYAGSPVGMKIFLSKLNPAGSSLVYSTYLGGSADDTPHGIAVDSAGNVYLTGTTVSADFPVLNAMQESRGGWRDGFLMKLQASGGALAYSTFLGGSGNDWSYGIALDSVRNVYLTGVTGGAADFPAVFPFQETQHDSDAFVMKISDSSPAYTIRELGGAAWQTSAKVESMATGYARIQPNIGQASPSGVAIFGFRQNGALVTEAGVPASPLIRSGRTHAEVSGPVSTGFAIANPNSDPAVVSFFFTDANGNDFGHGTTTVSAGGQIARFLHELPFAGGNPIHGTFSFSSSRPISVIALRGYVNERSEFLLTTLPVSEMSSAASDPVVFPHFADGGGWFTQLVLINPTDEPMNGSAEFYAATGEPGTVTIDDLTDHKFNWSIPQRSSRVLRTSGSSAATLAGWVLVTPGTDSKAPSGLAIFSYMNLGVTVAEAGAPAAGTGSAFRMYVEASGGEGSIQTGIAVANPSTSPAPLTFELSTLSGTGTGHVGTSTVPAKGQIALFLKQIPGFESLPSPFRGVLRVSTKSTAAKVSVIGLRGRYNERHDFLITTTPPSNEATPASVAELIFPHFVRGGGYTTQFVLFSGSAGQSSSGVLRFYSQAGQALP
ncbi:MAG TPA: SBBP repeat-containing protein [Acidobacteriota bacterium]|nr:SBBP repeat-containing protein [Acidobacteriota bacterium]